MQQFNRLWNLIVCPGRRHRPDWLNSPEFWFNEKTLRKAHDQPIGALLADLEQRGLLDETLVIWGGEFGRLPISQPGSKPGRGISWQVGVCRALPPK